MIRVGLTRRAASLAEGSTMTETLEPMADEMNQLELAQQLLAQAEEQGV